MIPRTYQLLLLLCLALFTGACTQEITEPMGEPETEVVTVALGSPEAMTVLAFVNDLNVDVVTLDEAVGLDSRAANNIIEHRDGGPGAKDDNFFDDIEELDAVPYVGERALSKILAYAIQMDESPPAIDLVVVGAGLATNRGEPDEVIEATCEVRNQGSQEAGASRLKYYFSEDERLDDDDKYLNYDRVPALAPGEASVENANLRIPEGTPDGYYFMLLLADANAEVNESDEANVVALPVMVGAVEPLADLRADDVQVQSPSVRAGETIDVSATVINDGFTGAEASRMTYLLSTDRERDAGDRQLSHDSVGALSPNGTSPESASLRVTAATPAGSYFLLFVVDADSDVHEFNEDNILAVPVLVTRDNPSATLADLVVENPSLEGSDGDFTISMQIANRGVATAETCIMRYYVSPDATFEASDRYINYDRIGELAVDASGTESANLSLSAEAAAGGWYVIAVVDANNDVAERYESNNVIALPIISDDGTGPIDNPDLDAPDLMVVASTADSAAIAAGTRANLTVQIENVGAFPAGTSKVKYYLSRDTRFDGRDDYVGYDNVPALLPGETAEESVTPLIPETAQHGAWYLLAVVDAALEVTETFESNNVRATPIEVTVDDPSLVAADLYVSSASLDRNQVAPGRKVYVDFAIDNGGVALAQKARIKFYLSGDSMHDADDVYLGYRDTRELAVGGRHTLEADLRLPVHYRTGAAQLLIVVDTYREVEESYESNNVHSLPLSIGSDSTPEPSFPYACPDSVFVDADLLPRDTVATLNTLHLGYENGKEMTALACIVAHFDLVGLQEIEDPAGVIELEMELEELTGEVWSSHTSEHAVGWGSGSEYYAYVWRQSEVTMTESLGFYPDVDNALKREPYGANFRMGSFDFTYVIFHQRYGELRQRRAEASHLGFVYDYFQAENGRESDVLIGGDFNLPGDDAAYLFLGTDGMDYVTDPEQKTSIGLTGLSSSFDNIFYTSATTEMIGSGAHDYTQGNWSEVLESVTDHIPVWAEFDLTRDDD